MTDLELWRWQRKEKIWYENKDTDTEVMVSEINGVLYIGFKGSSSGMDWKQNFMFWKKPYRGMKNVWFAHAGFLKKWVSVKRPLRIRIMEELKNVGEVVVVGHSQGGAVAQLCCEDIRFRLPNLKVKCVVFGSPRVFGFWNFWVLSKRLSVVKRYECVWDIVVKLPLLVFGYRHYGKRVRVGDWKKYMCRFVKAHEEYGKMLEEV